MSSPSTICSVKFLQPTTMRSRWEQAESDRDIARRTTSSKTPPCLSKKRRDKDGAPDFDVCSRISRPVSLNTLWREMLFEPAQQRVRRQRHQRRWDCAGQNDRIIHHRQTAKDQFA